MAETHPQPRSTPWTNWNAKKRLRQYCNRKAFPDIHESPWPWIQDPTLRPKSEILDASDLIYRLHWATRQAQVEGKPTPPGVDAEVVEEWYHAVNWLTNYGDERGWDHVETDT